MESLITPPIIDLDCENNDNVLLSAKTLGYFYIPRSSSYGQIPQQKSLRILIEELFDLSTENKFFLGSDYIRSTNLSEPPIKNESFSFTSTSEMIKYLEININQKLIKYLVNNYPFV